MDKIREGWQGFIELCSNSPGKKELDLMFDLFLTMEEKDSLALRFLIVQELLREQKTQREIAKELNVSIAKITRGSNELKRMSPNLIAYLRKVLSA
jgi:TrpR family trp operon transcriptional repressor